MKKLFVTFEEKSGPLCLALLMLVLGLQVFGRALGFGVKLVWTDEAARVLFVWSVFLSLPLASKKGAMIHIKLSEKLWPRPLKNFMPRAAQFLWALCCLFLAGLCLMNIYGHWHFPLLTPILGLNQNHLFLVMPLALTMTAGRIFHDLLRGAGRPGEPPAAEGGPETSPES